MPPGAAPPAPAVPGAGKKEGESRMGGRELLKCIDHLEMALERAESSYETEESRVERQTSLAAGAFPGPGMKTGGIDPIDDHLDLFRREPQADEALPQSGGDRMDAAHAAVEEPADQQAMGSQLRGSQLRMLSMQDGCGREGERGIDQRAEVMGVHQVRPQLPDVAGERGGGGRGRSPLSFPGCGRSPASGNVAQTHRRGERQQTWRSNSAGASAALTFTMPFSIPPASREKTTCRMRSGAVFIGTGPAGENGPTRGA